MKQADYDILVIGSGFGGSLMALILKRLGYRMAVVDRATHPRFAIGESSTPIADAILRDLTKRFDLPKLAPLCAYGSARRELPDVTVGLKRGFSYFQHQSDRRFDANRGAGNQLIVAASSDDEHSDTHWLRSEVDHMFARQLDTEEVDFFPETNIELIERKDRWQFKLRSAERLFDLGAAFVIDASGAAGVLLRALGIERSTDGLWTNSRAIYGHFANVTTWHDQYLKEGGDVRPHPFRCDQAAVHQLIRDGWMWQLGFDNGIVSAGFALQCDHWAHIRDAEPIEQWDAILRHYPSLASQFADARLVAPPGGPRQTGRLQYLAEEIAGRDWACLPATAGFIDPLHSTGIAHTLCGIERLAQIFAASPDNSDRRAALLQSYADRLRREFQLVDRLIYACYLAINDFEDFVAASMLYFAAATSFEQRRFEWKRRSEARPNTDLFLCADNAGFCECVDRAVALLSREQSKNSPRKWLNSFPVVVKELLEPYNLVGLCDASVANMYQYTTAPEKT